MKRVPTTHEYHDALIVEYQWVEHDQLLFNVELNGPGNAGVELVVSLRFNSVRNREQVDSQIKEIDEARAHDRYFAEIVGIWKEASHLFLIDTGYGPIQIDAGSMLEF